MTRKTAADAVCVFCRQRAVDPQWRPFCSERCKLRDLARWADGTYRVPGETTEAPDEAAGDTDEKPD